MRIAANRYLLACLAAGLLSEAPATAAPVTWNFDAIVRAECTYLGKVTTCSTHQQGVDEPPMPVSVTFDDQVTASWVNPWGTQVHYGIPTITTPYEFLPALDSVPTEVETHTELSIDADGGFSYTIHESYFQVSTPVCTELWCDRQEQFSGRQIGFSEIGGPKYPLDIPSVDFFESLVFANFTTVQVWSRLATVRAFTAAGGGGSTTLGYAPGSFDVRGVVPEAPPTALLLLAGAFVRFYRRRA